MKAEVEIQLMKLTDGGRLLRLREKSSGLCLEKQLTREQPVARQKARLFSVFEDCESRAQTSAKHSSP